MLQCTAAAIFSALTSLLLKRHHPELSFSLSTLTLALILLSSLRLLTGAADFVRSVRTSLGANAEQLQPVLKCLGIAVVSRFGAGLCRDASQSALGAAVETAGLLCAAAVAMPSVLTMVNMAASFL
ncbi:MAG: stage III sporulation AC/AD family protein [Oscillospiraceae bacterium]|nr:stage III sporulation AC/AD family protein [Oscillospiraceae bacterium]